MVLEHIERACRTMLIRCLIANILSMIFNKCFKELKTFTALLSELLCMSELLWLSCRRKENLKSAIHLWFIPLVILRYPSISELLQFSIIYTIFLFILKLKVKLNRLFKKLKLIFAVEQFYSLSWIPSWTCCGENILQQER